MARYEVRTIVSFQGKEYELLAGYNYLQFTVNKAERPTEQFIIVRGQSVQKVDIQYLTFVKQEDIKLWKKKTV